MWTERPQQINCGLLRNLTDAAGLICPVILSEARWQEHNEAKPLLHFHLFIIMVVYYLPLVGNSNSCHSISCERMYIYVNALVSVSHF